MELANLWSTSVDTKAKLAMKQTFNLAEARPANRPAFGGTVPLFYQMSRVPLNHGNVPLFVRNRIFFARAQFVTMPRLYQTVARPNRRATVYFGTELISVACIILLKSQCGPCQPSRFLPASPAFLREMSL